MGKGIFLSLTEIEKELYKDLEKMFESNLSAQNILWVYRRHFKLNIDCGENMLLVRFLRSGVALCFIYLLEYVRRKVTKCHAAVSLSIVVSGGSSRQYPPFQ